MTSELQSLPTTIQSSRTVYDAAIIQFPKILDDRGNFTFVEENRHIPFSIARVYWIYDVPGGESRGSHAYRELQEVIIALSGSFEVFLDDGLAQKTITLNRAYNGLYVPNMVWRRMQHFSTNAVALVLASLPYSVEDYIRDYQEFQKDEWKTLKTTVHDCKLIELPKISERKGAITPIYGGVHVPFDVARVYYLYDVPGGESRGGHAHRELQQLIVSVMGAFDVVLDDGNERRRVHLDRAYYGLHIQRMIWRELENFSSGGICLVLASLPYDENDYLRDYNDYLQALKG